MPMKTFVEPMAASIRSLKLSAALVWVIGGIILASKGYSLFAEAVSLKPEASWTWLTVVGGVFLGLLKAKHLFRKVCEKNLARIDSLLNPTALQFYRPGFFVFLAAMIALGAALSRLAHGNYPFLIGVAMLDFSLATALLGSSLVFWEQKAFRK